MDSFKRQNQARYEEFTGLLWELLMNLELLPQVTTTHQVHDEVEVAFLLQCVVQLDHKVALNLLHEVQLVYQIAYSSLPNVQHLIYLLNSESFIVGMTP